MPLINDIPLSGSRYFLPLTAHKGTEILAMLIICIIEGSKSEECKFFAFTSERIIRRTLSRIILMTNGSANSMAAMHCMFGMLESDSVLRRLLQGGKGSTSFAASLLIAASSFASFTFAVFTPAGPVFADLSLRPNASGGGGLRFLAPLLLLLFCYVDAACFRTLLRFSISALNLFRLSTYIVFQSSFWRFASSTNQVPFGPSLYLTQLLNIVIVYTH